MNTLKLSVLATSALLAHSAFAQEWPAKNLTLVVPFPAGGGTDAFARPLSAIMSKSIYFSLFG